MSTSILFPEPTTASTGPLANLEPHVVWLQRSTQSEAAAARRRVNAWYQDFPDPDGQLAAKLTSTRDEVYYVALDELYVPPGPSPGRAGRPLRGGWAGARLPGLPRRAPGPGRRGAVPVPAARVGQEGPPARGADRPPKQDVSATRLLPPRRGPGPGSELQPAAQGPDQGRRGVPRGA